TVAVGAAGQDDRVQEHDVGHREEGDDAAAHLTTDRRAPLGDLEEGVHGEDRTRSAPMTCHLSETADVASATLTRWTRSRRCGRTRSATAPTSSPTSTRSTSTACARSRS